MTCRNKILDLHSEALHITDHGIMAHQYYYVCCIVISIILYYQALNCIIKIHYFVSSSVFDLIIIETFTIYMAEKMDDSF